MANNLDNRRPLALRSSAWAGWCATALVRSSMTPNQISVISIFFAALGAVALLCMHGWIGLVLAALGVQLRLLCNLLDGMVAIEGGKKSALGALYNEFPDRIADSILIVALGYATPWPWLGWFGALAAALTAYIRAFGGAQGFAQDFRGPMAKPHRMAAMTVGCLLGAIELMTLHSTYALTIAAVIIATGSVITCVTRIIAIAQLLNDAQKTA